MENYFNYFTEIEECFRHCRGTTTLLSTLDWALIESWKEAGVPLEAALIGIERAFDRFAKRPRRFRKINGLAYCSQLVHQAADELNRALAEGGPKAGTERAAEAPFTNGEIRRYLFGNAEALEKARGLCVGAGQQLVAEDLCSATAVLRATAASMTENCALDLQELERRLAVLEEKLTASLMRAASVEILADFRREVDRELIPYRRSMTGAQIESLERQFLKKQLFEHLQIPRLSLFYL